LRIVLQRHVPEETHLQVQWNALIERMESPEVFYTHEWALAMQRSYGSVLVPFVVLAYEGERRWESRPWPLIEDSKSQASLPERPPIIVIS